ncbi:MAG: tyrosine-protein phosphatase [Terriglobales bacterium]
MSTALSLPRNTEIPEDRIKKSIFPMIDIHCHVLPGIDDGAASWEVAMQMCKMAARGGIEHIVATPHANNRFRYDRPRLAALLKELENKVNGRPRLSLGCDFHLSYDNFLAVLEHPSQFTIDETGYLLLELDDYSVPASVSGNLQRLISAGLAPIITHPERNPILLGELERVIEWVDQGCLVQVTANSFTGRWGDRAKSAAEWLLEREAIHVVASDAHGIGSRPPLLAEAKLAIATLAGEPIAKALVSDNPRAIVRGEKLPSHSRLCAHTSTS